MGGNWPNMLATPRPTGCSVCWRRIAGRRWSAGGPAGEYVAEHLGDPAAVLVVDETGFLKQGQKSVGVQRQYSGMAGQVENCQIGVFLAYGSKCGRTFLDRELYLPQGWAGDWERRREAGVPGEVVFRTKGQLAQVMIARAVAAGVPFGLGGWRHGVRHVIGQKSCSVAAVAGGAGPIPCAGGEE